MAKRTRWFASLVVLAVLSVALLRILSGIRRTVADTAALLPDELPSTPELGRAVFVLRATDAGQAPQGAAALTAGASSEPDPSTATRAPQACGGDMRLLASVVNATAPRRSMAALELAGGTRLVHVGDRVGDATFVELAATRAYLRGADGATCVLRVTPERARAGQVGRAVLARKSELARSKSGLLAQELAAGIRKLGGDKYAVSRELLERMLSDPSALRQSGRFRVVKKDGRVEGLQLMSARPQSALAHLGIKKGDIVRNLNGFDLSNPGGALEAMSMLKSRATFSLAVLRDGAPRTLSYVVE